MSEQAHNILDWKAELPPDGNFAAASYRARLPAAGSSKAALILVPGSNGDGRYDVRDPYWVRFADKHSLALVGCALMDRKPSLVEQYIDMSTGSGQTLLDALDHFGLGETPLLLWGHSAGGEFNYEFTCWLAPHQPTRIRAFVVNKGGIYCTALAPQEARDIPALWCSGKRDAVFRQAIIHGIAEMNIAVGAKWKEHAEPFCGHELGESPRLAIELYESVLKELK